MGSVDPLNKMLALESTEAGGLFRPECYLPLQELLDFLHNTAVISSAIGHVSPMYGGPTLYVPLHGEPTRGEQKEGNQ